MARSTGAAEQPNWPALKQMTGAGMSPTSIKRLAHATPDALEVAGLRRRGNPTQTNWAVQNRLNDQKEASERGREPAHEARDADDMRGHPNRQAAIPFRQDTVRNNADPGPWDGLLGKVVGTPKTPRVGTRPGSVM